MMNFEMREVTIVCEDCGHRWRAKLYSAEETRERQRKGYPMGPPFCEKCGSARCRPE